ncbi:MAG: hypothetical protein ACKO1F_07000 [Flammeovirgaceae bacterium]
MKNKTRITDSPSHCANMVLAAGANVSTRNEAHGLEGFGSESVVRPTSWCDVLIIFYNFNIVNR